MAQSEVQTTMSPEYGGDGEDGRTGAVLAVPLGLAAACWVVAIHQMNGMEYGDRNAVGSFGFFIAVWVAMMVAMMLPGVIPAVMRRANTEGGARRAAVRRLIPGRLGTRGCGAVCAVSAAWDGGGRGSGDRGRALRADAAQAALPTALPREPPFGRGLLVTAWARASA